MKKILLVDDDALVLELYRKKLAAGGFEVRTANDGLDAIKLLGSYTPDFVVLDLMMPKLSGVDVIKYMRGKPTLANVPVVVLTNSFMSDQARSVNSLGVTHAIVKGDCTPTKMLEIANQVLGGNTPVLASPTDTSLAKDEARENFLKNAAAEFTDLRTARLDYRR